MFLQFYTMKTSKITDNNMEMTFSSSVNTAISHEFKNPTDDTAWIKTEAITVNKISDNREKEHICRLCGKIGFNYLPIFGNDNLLIAEKIGRCLPIIVLSTDDLPSHICSRCLRDLNISHKLIVTSLKIDSYLRRQLIVSKDTTDSRIDKNDMSGMKIEKYNSENYLDVCMGGLSTESIYGPIKCEICCKIYVDMDKFDRHIETEHLLPWPCSLCDKSFETSVLLVAHKEKEHAGNVLICTGCIDEERLAHGLKSLAEIQNNRIPMERIKKRPKKNNNLSKKTQTSHKESNVENKTETRWLAMCDICKIAFGSEELLSAHRRIHESKILRCYICQTEVTSIYDLFMHKREMHNLYKRIQLKFVCETCGKFFSNNWQWLNHQEKVKCKSKPSRNTCKYCNNDFATSYKLTRHLRTHRNEMMKDPSATIYRCIACPKIFVDKEFYQKHRNVHDPECWNKFKCDLCDRSFRDKMRLREHHQSIHEGLKPHQCDVCGRTFHRSSNMRVHRKNHFGQKCDYCDQVFEKTRFLADHIKDVHNLEPNFKLRLKKPYTSGCFICRYCGKKLATHQSLLDHEHIHTDEKPYPCKVCNKSFRSCTARWTHAQRHMKGTFICEHCGKSFSYKQNLTTHIQIHLPMESRKHRCSKCDKRFLRKSHLNVHMRIHDGVRPYKCDICQFSFTQLGDMRRHRDRHANNDGRTKRQSQTHSVTEITEEDISSEKTEH